MDQGKLMVTQTGAVATEPDTSLEDPPFTQWIKQNNDSKEMSPQW